MRDQVISSRCDPRGGRARPGACNARSAKRSWSIVRAACEQRVGRCRAAARRGARSAPSRSCSAARREGRGPSRRRRAARAAASTSSTSIPSGTPISDMPTNSFSSPTLPHRITAATARLITGSTHCCPVHRITRPGEHHGGGDRGVGGHVHEGGADVEVVLAAAREQHRGEHVADDRDRGDPDHRLRFGRRRVEQPAHRLRRDRSDRDQQEQGVDQRGEDRGLLEAVGEARRRRAPAPSPRRPRRRPARARPTDCARRRRSAPSNCARKPKTSSTTTMRDVERDADAKARVKSLPWRDGARGRRHAPRPSRAASVDRKPPFDRTVNAHFTEHVHLAIIYHPTLGARQFLPESAGLRENS